MNSSTHDTLAPQRVAGHIVGFLLRQPDMLNLTQGPVFSKVSNFRSEIAHSTPFGGDRIWDLLP